MNTVIGVYDNHTDAVSDILKLKESGYKMADLSLLAKGGEEIIDEDGVEKSSKLQVVTKTPIKISNIAASALIGSTIGLLSGVGLFLIPGVGVLFGAGALVGAIAGFDFGLLGGGIAALLTAGGMKEEYGRHYENLVNKGKHILITHGNDEEANHAKDILHTHGLYEKLSINKS